MIIVNLRLEKNILLFLPKHNIMKHFKSILLCSLLFLSGYVVKAEGESDEKLNLPGDNLNLYAVMNLFQESETLEGFERNLNAEDSKINNLDLNNDDEIDYIKVIDYVDGEAHTIVLQIAVTEKENQDVAVFTVQKDGNNQVQVQLVGDEELYGKDYIIEPNYADASDETPNPGYTGNTKTVEKETVVVTKTTYVEVASWPVVTYIYTPSYVVYRSPWYWGYYPPYWNPWRPFYWDYYYGYHSHYHGHYYGHYRHSYHYRYSHYNDHYYHGHRSYSNTVNRHRESGSYRNTYNRPETRQQGSADFNKKYPNGYKPAARPGTNNVNRPATKPGTNTNATRPTTKPGTNTNATRPTTKPGTNDKVTRPSTKPGTVTNGSRPATKPEVTKPATRPTGVKPATKPAVTKPATTNPTGKPAVSKPATRPTNTKPAVNQPSGKPSNTRPSTQPAAPKQTAKPAGNKVSTGTQKAKTRTATSSDKGGR
jgi:hypothetical protein